jgi:hypothetical protein
MADSASTVTGKADTSRIVLGPEMFAVLHGTGAHRKQARDTRDRAMPSHNPTRSKRADAVDRARAASIVASPAGEKERP